VDVELKKRVEAVLFMSTEPITAEKIATVIGVGSPEAIREALAELINEYNARESAVAITHSESAYIMGVRDQYLDVASRVAKNSELSKNVLKTLAYIAKKEGNTGVMQSQVIRSLGASAYGHIHTLLEKRFINARKKGRSKVLNTTSKFREYFKVSEL